MTKRLLLVLTEFPPSFGGMQTHALELSQWLFAQGYYVEVATYRLEEGPMGLPELPFVVHRVMSRVAYQANLRKLAQLARAMKAALIYSSTVYYGELGSMTGVPVFCRSAGNDVLRPWIAWPFVMGSGLLDLPWVERYLYRKWKRWNWPAGLEGMMLERRAGVMRGSAGRMERIFANSDFTRSLLGGVAVEQARVWLLPGGVDVRFFAGGVGERRELGMAEGEFYLLTACRLVEKKGLKTLLEAVALLRDKQVHVRLLIAGDGVQRGLLENWIVASGLDAVVELLGYVEHKKLRDYLRASDAFVLSSIEVVHPKTGLRDVETMGRVLCEASASGLPVVATASGGIPSVVEDGVNGLLARPGCAVDLASKIEILWRDRELGQMLGRQGKARAEKCFDWTVIFAEHERAIQAILHTVQAG